jgi:putative ABC transport system permease protein
MEVNMFKNYILAAVRNLKKYKMISFINLFGLTVGLTCCILILSYILNELSYDNYNDRSGQVYRITRSFNTVDGAEILHLSGIAPPFGYYLKNDFPEIQQMARIAPNGTTTLRYQEKIFNESQVYFADEHFFDLFSVPVLEGNPNRGLNDPFSVMMTPEMARKYFGEADPINKVIRMSNTYNLRVTGIFEKFPANSHLHPDILLSFNTLNDSTVYGEKNLQTNWGNNFIYTYLLLPMDFSAKNMEARFPSFLDRHMSPKDNGGLLPSKTTALWLQKMMDIHLRSHLDDEIEQNGDIKRIYIFSAIAIFILLIACINYMNLSTARSALRAREIGIRKVVGARKKELINQFLSESVLLSMTAFLLAMVIFYISLPALNKLTGQKLGIGILLHWKILLPVLLAPIGVGTLSGLYPALFMSSFQPVKTLKGLFKAGGSSTAFRKALVVAQFAISIILIISTAIVFEQLGYMQRKSLGYDKDHIVTIPYPPSISPQFETFRNELLQSAYIREAGRSSRIPTGRLLDGMGAGAESGDSIRPVKADIRFVAADYDFIPTYQIPLVSGRNFSRDFATDTTTFLLNQAALTVLGWTNPEKAIGRNFQYGFVKGKVIGVMRDFHFESLHQKIVPLVLILPSASRSGFFNELSIKIEGAHVAQALSHIQETWKKFLPETPFEFTFLDERFGKLYQSEEKEGTLFTWFSCIAIFIACLGLFGLSAFAITQRLKELGIRKVLGASMSSIVGLLSKDFLKLILIAWFIAFPVSWYAMHQWLQDFAYHILIPWWLFILAGTLALTIALVTISSLAIKAASANPVNSLRTE